MIIDDVKPTTERIQQEILNSHEIIILLKNSKSLQIKSRLEWNMSSNIRIQLCPRYNHKLNTLTFEVFLELTLKLVECETVS